MINYTIIMRNEVFPLPQIYPVLSLVCWLLLLLAYLVPHVRPVLSTRPSARQVGTQVPSVTPPSAHCTYHLRRVWFLVFISSSLKKNQHSTYPTASLSVDLIFQDAQTTGHREGRKAKDEKNVQRQEEAEKEEKSSGAKKRERREEAAKDKLWWEGGCPPPRAESVGGLALSSGFTLGPSCLDSRLFIPHN